MIVEIEEESRSVKLKRITAGTLIPLLMLCATMLWAEALDLLLVGKVEDFRLLPHQSRQKHEFTFVRLMYNGRIPGYIKNWYTDYPKGDRQIINILGRLTALDVAPEERALPIHHPDLFNYPMIYSAEGGQLVLKSDDAARLREYLDRGGFWMIDDFWGSSEWRTFEKEIKKVLPDSPIVELPISHPIFHSLFDIEEKMQVPNVGYGYCQPCHTWELDGYEPYVRGIFDENGRLLVFINFNTDLMDASEWSDDPNYPQKFSAYAYKIFSNAVVYALSH
jgi:hypothetical protein